MNILIINTAFDYADYIVLANDSHFAYKTDSNAKHSETSLLFVDNALTKSGITIRDIDVIAVNLGPGSFTGIRIGVALVKGFASALSNIKLIGFNSFEPLIERVKGNGNIYIETGKGDYYFANARQGKINEIECKLDIDEEEKFVILNNNSTYKEEELINIVLDKINRNEFCNINQLEPLYLKLSQAEQDLLKKN